MLPPFAGAAIIEATLEINVEGSSGEEDLAADLYGLGYRAAEDVGAAIVTPDMFYAGDFPDASATLLAEDVLVASTPADFRLRFSGAAILAYLNEQLGNGAEAGDYVYFRLNTNANPATVVDRVWFISAAVDEFGEPARPVLTVR